MDFYDGQGATAMGMEKELIDDMRGGPLTDGASLNDLNKMVPWHRKRRFALGQLHLVETFGMIETRCFYI